MALFDAYFLQQRDVSQANVLVDVATQIGLDSTEAQDVLKHASHASEPRALEKFWTDRGVSGARAMVFEGKYLLTGAQGAKRYA